VDSHVLFRPGALARLLDHVAADPDSRDLWQGPLVGDDLAARGTHFDPVWRAGMYGVWATDPRGLDPDAPPFEIPMQGLGVFGCRRAAWPGFNPRLRGFGGEEGYLHEKIRRAGGRTLCLPFLGWLHRFNRPFGPRYAVSLEDRVRNYLLVHDELGLDPSSAIEHFEQAFGAARVGSLVDRTRQELHGPFHFFDAIYGINLDRESQRWESLVLQCKALGIDHRLSRFSAIDTPVRPDVGRALSHRAVVAEASWRGLNNVLVLEDDIVFSRDAAGALTRVVTELAGRKWRMLYLDARSPEPPSSPVAPVHPGCDDTSLHAVAYHHTAYDTVLADLPATPTAMARWLEAQRSVDHYCADGFGGEALVTCPAVAVEAARVRNRPLFEPLTVDG
jgi:hypothetical protein